MITFAGGSIGRSVLYYENMHQWWGDNVTEAGYDMTFYKEGLATLAQAFYTALQAEHSAGDTVLRRGQPGSMPAWFRNSIGVTPWAAVPGSECRRTPPPTPSSRTLRPTSARWRRQLHKCPAGDPARLRRWQHRQGSAGGRVPPVDARSERLVQPEARCVLHPVVRHRIPRIEWGHQTPNHGSRSERTKLLQRRRSLQLSAIGRTARARSTDRHLVGPSSSLGTSGHWCGETGWV
jgi:hypothetical protein